jgi:hypothetical protein
MKDNTCHFENGHERGEQMHLGKDGKGQAKVTCETAPGGWKLAWIQHKAGAEGDWALTGRYLNIVRTEGPNKGPGGQATDFPIYSELPDEQILVAFVHAVSAITGNKISHAE